MKLAVVGGRLQGTEAVYLAKQAGYEVMLIDRNPSVPAASMADEFIVMDVLRNPVRAGEILSSADLIIPASEDILTLSGVYQLARKIDRPYAFDPRAYAVSSSKQTSNALFRLLNIPMPGQWPDCSLPVLVKPSTLSGSKGVKVVSAEENLKLLLSEDNLPQSDLIIEEFINGPSLSLEVIAINGESMSLQLTGLEFDSNYDCKRVLAGIQVAPEVEAELRKIGQTLARSLHLTGIMDIEVMLDGRTPKVIEIDARLPSQTPTAVLHSTGINMIKLLADVFLYSRAPKISIPSPRAVIYEHARVCGDRLEFTGEHIMASAGQLSCCDSLFGFDRVITNYNGESGEWVATLVTTESDMARARAKRQEALKRLMKEHNIRAYTDLVPPEQMTPGIRGVAG